MDPLTPAQLQEYREFSKSDYAEMARQLALCPRLFALLQKNWGSAVCAHIDRMQVDLTIDNAAYHLFRIFRDEPGLIQEIEDGLACIEPRARAAGKLDSFRETPLRLLFESMKQINQIEGAIFEILVLRGLIRAAAKASIKLDLYPKVGTGGSNIEARLWIDGRWCNAEAKALGYTDNMPGAGGARVFSRSIESMTAPIGRALAEKAANKKQIALVSAGESAVILLAQKGDIVPSFARSAVEDFLNKHQTPLSAVVLFGSSFCRTTPDLVSDPAAPSPLTVKETAFFQGLHKHMGFHLNDYIDAGREILAAAKDRVIACTARPQANMRERVVMYLVAKAVTTFEAVLTLEEHGHGLDAGILARSLLEAFAKARYICISSDPEATAIEFVDSMKAKTAKTFNRVAKYDGDFFDDFLEQIDPQGTIRNAPEKAAHWTDNVKEVFDKIKDADTGPLPYEWYVILCNLVHSNAPAMPHYMDLKDGCTPFIAKAERPAYRTALLHPLCAIMMMAVKDLCTTFSVAEPAAGPSLIAKLQALPPAPTRA